MNKLESAAIQNVIRSYYDEVDALLGNRGRHHQAEALSNLERLNKKYVQLKGKKMKNAIANWSYEKPSDEGDYLACYGDVETPANVHYLRLKVIDGELRDESTHTKITAYGDSYKFAQLVFCGSEVKEML